MDEERAERKPLRLKDYDYSGAGYYFITICTQNRIPLFWDVRRAGLEPAPTNALNTFGDIAKQTWLELPLHTNGIRVDKFVVMPNHFHGIVVIENGCVGAGSKPARTPVTEAIRQFKTFSARKINQMRGTPGKPVWQRGFYDHIIRSEPDYLRVWSYIDTNPAKWAEDEYYIPPCPERGQP